MSTFRPLSTSNSQGQNYSQVNDMVRQINREQTTKVYGGANGTAKVTIGKLEENIYGISFSDGDVTFLTITKDGIILNDGTNDRILIGKDEAGF